MEEKQFNFCSELVFVLYRAAKFEENSRVEQKYQYLFWIIGISFKYFKSIINRAGGGVSKK